MDSVRNGYEKFGVENYYKLHSKDYKNPHRSIIEKILSDTRCNQYIKGNVLDLCCGSGEVTKILKSRGLCNECIGCDPYTYDLYKEETGCQCLQYSFKDIALGVLSSEDYSVIVCSFALHLCESSMLDTVLYQLSRISDILIIITPHKRPEIRNYWNLVDEFVVDRVRCRIYKRSVF